VEAEGRCKRLVRPDWKLARWHRDDLRSRPWPAPAPAALASGRGCQRLSARAAELLDPSCPAILEGMLDLWPDRGHWELESLLREYGDADLVVGAAAAEAEGEDGGGEAPVPVTMTLQGYCDYASRQHDDCPLYIFDEAFLDGDVPLAASYSRPPCFPEDFMDSLGEQRPPHRWLLIGAERAGTALHVDPLETAAWNTLVSGRKRWVLFPPGAEEDGLRAAPRAGGSEEEEEEEEDTSDSAGHWLHFCYPSASASASGCMDFVQEPGETVYVPNGWWHNVVNLEFSVAVTENFVGRHNLAASHRAMQTNCPELAERWTNVMEEDPSMRPHAASLR